MWIVRYMADMAFGDNNEDINFCLPVHTSYGAELRRSESGSDPLEKKIGERI